MASVGYDGAVNVPISQVIVPTERFGSMMEVTNMISAEKIALRITPANKRACMGNRPYDSAMRYTTTSDNNPPAKPQSGNTEKVTTVAPTPSRIARVTPNAAPLDTPST